MFGSSRFFSISDWPTRQFDFMIGLVVTNNRNTEMSSSYKSSYCSSFPAVVVTTSYIAPYRPGSIKNQEKKKNQLP